jgi:hypothetical protein
MLGNGEIVVAVWGFGRTMPNGWRDIAVLDGRLASRYLGKTPSYPNRVAVSARRGRNRLGVALPPSGVNRDDLKHRGRRFIVNTYAQVWASEPFAFWKRTVITSYCFPTRPREVLHAA